MNPSPVFLAVEQVLAIHRRMVDEFGGEPTIRDRGLLESAVRLPQATFERRFLHQDVPAMAAAYLFHLCRNHPFVDGTKRTALAAAEIFLRLNDFEFDAGDAAVEELTMGVPAGKVSKQAATSFFVEHVSPNQS